MVIQTKIIAVEGIDGAGKSTFCTVLRDKIPSSSVMVAKTPFGELNRLTDIARKEGRMAAFCAYMLSNLATIRQFGHYDWLILDRYVLSTIVYHADIFESLSTSLRRTLLDTMSTPVLTIHLIVDPAVVADRLSARSEKLANHTERSADLNERFQNYINHPEVKPILGKLLVLNSNTLSEQEHGLKTVMQELSSTQ